MVKAFSKLSMWEQRAGIDLNKMTRGIQLIVMVVDGTVQDEVKQKHHRDETKF